MGWFIRGIGNNRRCAFAKANGKIEPATNEELKMSQQIPSQIEESFNQLSPSEQSRVIEYLIRRMKERGSRQPDHLDSELAAMAVDPDIQAELREIEREFSHAER